LAIDIQPLPRMSALLKQRQAVICNQRSMRTPFERVPSHLLNHSFERVIPDQPTLGQYTAGLQTTSILVNTRQINRKLKNRINAS
jgi:hypothetical protein